MSKHEIINAFIQDRLCHLGLNEVSAVDAAKWLDEAGVLRDSSIRPGLPLRKYLRKGVIVGSSQEGGRFWRIRLAKLSDLERHRHAQVAKQPKQQNRDAQVKVQQSIKSWEGIDSELLQGHIRELHTACEHWTRKLLEAPAIPTAMLTRESIEKVPGVYLVRCDSEIIYVGKSNNLCSRIFGQHLAPRMRSSTLRRKVSRVIKTSDEALITTWLQSTSFAWLALHDHSFTIAVEDYVILKLKPPLNGYT